METIPAPEKRTRDSGLRSRVRTDRDRDTTIDYWASSVRVYRPAPPREVTTASTAMSCECTSKGTSQTTCSTPAATLLDRVAGICFQELERNVHIRAVVERHRQGERLLDQEAVGIHICRIRETPCDDDTVPSKRCAQEVRRAGRIVRFHFARPPTVVVMVVMMIMVIVPAPAHDSHHQQDADPPPASACHTLSSLHRAHRGTILSTAGVRLPPVRLCLPCPDQARKQHIILT